MKLYAATQSNPPFGKPGSRSSWFKPTQKSNVYDAIVAAGADGIGRHDIAAKIGLQADRISFYLSDLRRAGFISVKGSAPDLTQMNAQDAKFYAMEVLEGALAAKIKEQPVYTVIENGKSIQRRATKEQNLAFVKYNKIKQYALRGATDGEVGNGLRMSLIELVKLLF